MPDPLPRWVRAKLFLCALPFLAGPASAADPALETGIGFTSGPSAALVTIAIPVEISPKLAVGPLLQLGFGRDNRVIVAPTLDLRLSTSLGPLFGDDPGSWENFELMGHAGLGFAYLEKERRGDDDDTGFLFNFGAGIDYVATDRITLGTRMTFNILPTGVLNEDFFFSWQLIHLRVRF